MCRVDADVGEESSHPTMLTLASADRGVAQPGQSIGLQNRGPRVRILPPLPIFSHVFCRHSPREGASTFFMPAIKTINLPYGCVATSVSQMSGRARSAADAVLYG